MGTANRPNANKLFFSSIQAQRSDVGIITIYAIVIGLLYLVLPLAVQELIGIVAFGIVIQPIIVLSLLVMCIVEIIQQRLFVQSSFEMISKIKSSASHALNNKQINMFFEVLSLQKAYSKLLINGLGASLQAIVGLIVLACYHPMFIFLASFLLAGTLVCLFWGGRGALTNSLIESHHKYDLIHWLQEVGYCNDYFKLVKTNKLLFQKTDQINLDYIKARNEHFKILIRQYVLTYGVQIIGNGSLLALGGWLVIQGQLTLGQLIAAELVVASIISGIDKVVNQADVFYDLLTALTKLEMLKTSAQEIPEGKVELPYKKQGLSVECRKLSFGHKNTELQNGTGRGSSVISDLNLNVASGKKIAIYGGQSSGKRTLINLLTGLYHSTQGSIYLDEQEIRNIKISSLGESVSMIKADINAVFEGSIYDNILMGREEIVPVKKVIELTGLIDDLDTLQNGIKTQLVSQGLNISLSQVTRILIARALISAPRLLLISQDALNNIADDRLMSNIIKELDELFGFQPTIIFFSSHNLKNNLDVELDQQLLLENGSLKEL
jgi:ABC-type bacteriocin/lantibiotic exporter with double-glycine peptidase domain